MLDVSDMITFGSLFAGIGGFDLGFERAGMVCQWQIEIDPFCQKVLRKHFPRAVLYGDIRQVTNLPYVEVMCGGFPCQDISGANPNGKGLEGERSGLWREYARLIRAVKPRWVVVENVARLLSINDGRDFGTVLRDLDACGYDAEWDVLSAAAFGAPHLRERIFIVAHLKEEQTTGLFKRGVRGNNAAEIGTNFTPDALALGRRGRDTQGLGDHRQERIQRVFAGEIQRFNEFSWCENVRRVEDLRDRQDIPEPLFCGARDGVPDWVDRIGSIGNAVVPAIAEWIGRRITAIEQEQSEILAPTPA